MINFLTKFVKSYFHYGVSRSSAGLAYYLTFSFFPLIIFLNSLVGIIDIQNYDFYSYIELFPAELQVLINDYLNYLTSSNNYTPLFVGLFLTLYSFTRYVNHLYHIINNIYGFERPSLSMIKSFFFTIALMLSIYLLLILSVIGGQLIILLDNFIILPKPFTDLLNTYRYLIPAIYFFIVLVLMYRFIPAKKLSYFNVIPGAFCAVIAMFILSFGFSFYVSNFSNYSVIYGSLSAIMFLMMWLYFTSMVIVQGSVLNKLLAEIKKV